MEIWDGEGSEAIREQHLHPETLKIEACKNCFMPYDFVSPITNNFIHFTWINLPEYSALDFSNSVLALWEGMNDAMSVRDIPRLKSFVLGAFQNIDFGYCLFPQKKF